MPMQCSSRLLGVEGIRVTPLELAVAYRWLALQFAAHPDIEAAQVVRAGIEDSASFGMARSGEPGRRAGRGQDGNRRGHGVKPDPRLVRGPRARRQAAGRCGCLSARWPWRGRGHLLQLELLSRVPAGAADDACAMVSLRITQCLIVAAILSAPA